MVDVIRRLLKFLLAVVLIGVIVAVVVVVVCRDVIMIPYTKERVKVLTPCFKRKAQFRNSEQEPACRRRKKRLTKFP